MTIDEDTGEGVVCPICDAPEYWDCGHLVASLDRSFCECQGGELYDRDGEFTSIIEDAFLPNLQNGSEPKLEGFTIDELWEAAKANFDAENVDVDLDGYIFQRFLIELLEEVGAYDLPGPLMDPGGPGMTSSMSLLFAEKSSEVIDRALQQLSGKLNEEPRKQSPSQPIPSLR